MPGKNSNELSAVPGATPTPAPQPEADISLEETSTPVTEIPTHTPAPVPSPEAPVPQITPAAAGPDAFISYIMIGATAVGVVCALAGAFLALKMKKKRRF